MSVSQVISPQSYQDRLATILAPKEFTLQLWKGPKWEDLNIKWDYLYKAPQEQKGEEGMLRRVELWAESRKDEGVYQMFTELLPQSR